MELQAKIHAQWDSYMKEWRYSVFALDMSAYGYVFVGDVQVYFDPPPHAVLTAGTVAAFRAEQAKIRAEAEAKVTALQKEIDDMLCLEYTPEPQA